MALKNLDLATQHLHRSLEFGAVAAASGDRVQDDTEEPVDD